VTLYYHEELTMKEVGAVLRLTESRVSQLHSQAMLRLKGRLQSHFSGEVPTRRTRLMAATASRRRRRRMRARVDAIRHAARPPSRRDDRRRGRRRRARRSVRRRRPSRP